jgi:hypothetical protein
MIKMPMAKKLIAPMFLKKSEKYSTVSIVLISQYISQYHLDKSDVNSNPLPVKNYTINCVC